MITDPTALFDQVAAATHQARKALRKAAHEWGAQLDTGPLPPWLRDRCADLLAALAARRVRCCAHLAPAPRVAHAALWRPGLLLCSACVGLLAADPVEDATCDRCRRHVRRILPGTVALGPILLAYGLCQPCAAETDPA
ncbi:hypothetical protein GCM10012275_60330 [Longimycelium tulufanense]|uniref:Uncharacterized protein n=1 Tax=Longimycelium tulufanense TaxID=907463 RepID=A0A8J3CKE4_9PSEU|nr:hypothetical protein [Longimycelium tulufanense]GGM81632.1 hypothetical protein GCM10012275_60330 [Longimycelium tulufanense]